MTRHATTQMITHIHFSGIYILTVSPVPILLSQLDNTNEPPFNATDKNGLDEMIVAAVVVGDTKTGEGGMVGCEIEKRAELYVKSILWQHFPPTK